LQFESSPGQYLGLLKGKTGENPSKIVALKQSFKASNASYISQAQIPRHASARDI